ncbi:sialidase family protein [Desertimonas flava]|uniref:sialidase family protein n=1 Tax=Desertimonas flava TaxID=2064846 RepID=UPI000E350A03|nr:sialidase family protein [Desertimonas flava]
MIDLDDQLSAYSRYLDDLERPLVPVVPLDEPAAAPIRTSRRRLLSMSAAAAVAIAGGAVIARIATRGDGGWSNPSPPDPDWKLVPDLDGLFLPAPMGEDIIASATPNAIAIASVADTSFGLIAVGSERRDLITYNAMWRSADGLTWERLPNDDDFGPTEFTGSSARTLVNLVEFDGRLVGSDGSNFWRTDDLEHWESITIPRASSLDYGRLATSIAAGPHGVFAASFGLWFSPDGADWQVVDGYGDFNTAFTNAATFVDDLFVVTGSTRSERLVLTSTDGREWSAIELPGSDGDHPVAVAGTEDRLVVLGATSSEDMGWIQTLAWTSTDRGSTWTRTTLGAVDQDGVAPSAIVHVGGEFVALAARGLQADPASRQYRSPDGLEWTEYSVEPDGFRWAATAFGDGAVAVGERGWPWTIGGPEGTLLPDEAAADAANSASIWTLGL